MDHNTSELEKRGEEAAGEFGSGFSLNAYKSQYNPESLDREILTDFCLGELMFPKVLVMGFTGFI